MSVRYGPLFDHPLVVVDLETTGLPKEPLAQACEIGAVLLSRRGRVMAEMGALVSAPAFPGCEEAMAKNGIEWDDLEEATTMPFALLQLVALAGSLPGTRMTSFHVAFDQEFLARAGFRWVWGHCLMREATWMLAADQDRLPWQPDIPRRASLVRACEALGVEHDGGHRALPNARTAARLAVRMARLRRGQDTLFAEVSHG